MSGIVWRFQNIGKMLKSSLWAIKKGLSVKKRPLKNGAGEQIRTVVTSLEGWGSTIELRPQWVDKSA